MNKHPYANGAVFCGRCGQTFLPSEFTAHAKRHRGKKVKK